MTTALSSRRLVVALACLLPVIAAFPLLAESATAVRSIVWMAGHRAGEQIVEPAAGGKLHIRYSFNDRGRGPELESNLQLGKDLLPERITIQGHNYLKVPVSETFERHGERARWKNAAEEGTSAAASGRAYFSFDGPPEELALIASAALSRPDGRLPLLPAGEVVARRVASRRVAKGNHPAGSDGSDRSADSIDIALVEVDGLDFSPERLWLDGSGRLFAWVSPWLSIVREDYDAVSPELLKVQDERSTAHWREIAAHVTQRSGAFVIRGARLFDPATRTVREGMAVVVEGARVVGVSPEAEVQIPASARVLDARGKTLLPGLWDMHVHVGDEDGALHIAAGVTSVRDLGNDIDATLALKRSWESGATVGPRVTLAGIIDGPGEYAGPTKVLVSTEAEGEAAIERYADLGYEQIKLYSSLDPKLVEPLVRAAHRRGLRVSGHVPAFMTARDAVERGYDELQHVNFLFLNFLSDTVRETRGPARFTAVGEAAGEMNLDAPEVQEFLALLKQRRVTIDPTVAVFDSFFRDRPGKVGGTLSAVADRLPAQVRRWQMGGGLPAEGETVARYAKSADKLLEMVRRAWQAGVPVVAGTDSMAGFSLHRELELYVQAGIPAPEVLNIATLGAARTMRRAAELGSIEPGKYADMVLIDGRPDERISDVRNVVWTMKEGLLYESDAVYREIGVGPRAPNSGAEAAATSSRGPGGS